MTAEAGATDTAGPVHVALVTDAAYAPWTATTMASCAEATDAPLRFHVIHGADLGGDDQRRLRGVVAARGAAIEFHPADEERVALFPSKGPAFGGRMSWVRVALAELLPALDRVLYLDGDTLVVDSVLELWGIPLGDAPLAAVRNVTEPSMRGHVASIGIADPADYFNAGVLVVNLRQWRAEGATEALVEFVDRRGLTAWFDQDALNAVFADRWTQLDPRWNAMNSLWTWPDLAAEAFGAEGLRRATSSPGIVHFEGPTIAKPWHYLCTHPWRDDYRAVLARTWPGTVLEDRTVVTRLIARLPVERRLPAFVRLLRGRARVSTWRDRLSVHAPSRRPQ